MRRRISESDEKLLRMRGFADQLESKRSLYPAGLTWFERLERLFTDAPLQWFWRKLLFLLVIILPDKSTMDEENPAERALGRAHIRWVYGRSISLSAIEIAVTLLQLGMSRRDIRLAIFCRYVRDDGSIKINWFRERAMQACWWVLVTIVAVTIFDLIHRLMNSPVSFISSALIILVTIIILASALYPVYVLCIRAPYVARSLENIRKQHLIGHQRHT
ncbi:MAG: hypothetical protein AB2776_18645 [Candidatus Thiodiazotropha endolucinida]